MEILIEGRTLSPIWTGNLGGDGDKLARATGWRGSLRWWSEAIIRGMGGYACDPSDTGKRCLCEDGEQEHICFACRLWGCTGWRSNVKIALTDMNEKRLSHLGKGIDFRLRLKLRVGGADADLQQWLLRRVFLVIHTYGSVCGKTVLKPEGPQDARRAPHAHGDFGLIAVTRYFPEPPMTAKAAAARLGQDNFPQNEDDWPNFKYFWFAPGQHLHRRQLNALVGRNPNTGEAPRNPDPTSQFLQGRQGESKKVFSFLGPEGERLWGYARDSEMLAEVIRRLKAQGVTDPLTGDKIIQQWLKADEQGAQTP